MPFRILDRDALPLGLTTGGGGGEGTLTVSMSMGSISEEGSNTAEGNLMLLLFFCCCSDGAGAARWTREWQYQ